MPAGKDPCRAQLRHTDARTKDAARCFEPLAGNLDPASVTSQDLADLRAVVGAAEQVRRIEALVTERARPGRFGLKEEKIGLKKSGARPYG